MVQKKRYQITLRMKPFRKKVKMSHADSGTILMLLQYYVGCRIFIQVRC